MKKIIIFIVCFMCLFVMGCSKNEDTLNVGNSSGDIEKVSGKNNEMNNISDEFLEENNEKNEMNNISGELLEENAENIVMKNHYFSEYFSYSSTDKIEESALSSLSNEELDIAKNEIFARHGHDFSSKILKEYFNSRDWYQPISGKKVSVSELNEIEQVNIALIDKEIKGRNIEIDLEKEWPIIDFLYTSYEDLLDKNLIPNKPQIDKYYDVGKIVLKNNEYYVKYKRIQSTDTFFDIENKDVDTLSICDENGKVKLKFDIMRYDGVDYVKEISTFKGNYVILVTDNEPIGDSLQFMYIHNLIKEEKGVVAVHRGYENYYVINEDYIIYLDTEYNEDDNIEKVTHEIYEIDGILKDTIIDRTTDGAMGHAGRV